MKIHCGLDIKKFRKIKYELSSNDYVIFLIWEFFKKKKKNIYHVSKFLSLL